MKITTKFKRGDIVTDHKGVTFVIDEINVRLWSHHGQQIVNITYRSSKPNPDPEFAELMIHGPWRHEGQLKS